MKNQLTIIMLAALGSCANKQNAQIPQSLNQYLEIKNALINSDAKTSKLKAADLLKTIENMPIASLKKNEKNAFSKAQKTILQAAKTISTNTDIEKQRAAFATLSVALWPVIKVSESVTQQVYYAYCPMKDAYWISLEESIRNPYYGAKMLTCGNVNEKKKK